MFKSAIFLVFISLAAQTMRVCERARYGLVTRWKRDGEEWGRELEQRLINPSHLALFFNLTTSGYRRIGDLWAGTVVVEKDADYPTVFIEPTNVG